MSLFTDSDKFTTVVNHDLRLAEIWGVPRRFAGAGQTYIRVEEFALRISHFYLCGDFPQNLPVPL